LRLGQQCFTGHEVGAESGTLICFSGVTSGGGPCLNKSPRLIGAVFEQGDFRRHRFDVRNTGLPEQLTQLHQIAERFAVLSGGDLLYKRPPVKKSPGNFCRPPAARIGNIAAR